jgi:putative mRNA 3-end processing factor
MKGRPPPARAFGYGRGVRLLGTNVTCDALGAAADLVFLAHAQALGPAGGRRFPLRRGGRQELLVTDTTLTLLGAAGERLRRHALPAMFGRPFKLGEARLELFPSGHLPGAASLLVEIGGRSIVYAGTIRSERPSLGSAPAEVRRADALCIDATFGDPRFVLPPPEEALAAVRRFVEETAAAGRAPVLLTPSFSTAMDAAAELAEAGLVLRGHRAIVAASTAFRATGAGAPVIARFYGRLAANEVLLWPPEARDAPLLGALASPRFAFVSGFSLDPAAFARVRADAGIALSNQSGYPTLLAYIDATGAREVAVHRGHADTLAAALRARGHDAYTLGPPTQMELFRG